MKSIETIKQSIKVLENMKSWEDSDIKIEAIDIAISALQKQIPVKPLIRNWSPALCPTCNAELSESSGDGYYKHQYSKIICNCGQKLKWDDED